MRLKLIVIALAGFLAAGLTACDRNKHPASDTNEVATANTAADTSLSYDRNDTTTRDDLKRDVDRNAASNSTDTTNNSVTPNNTDNSADTGTSASTSNDNTPGSAPGAVANTTDPSQNPNAITNPNPTTTNNQ